MTTAKPPNRFRLWAGVPALVGYLAVAAIPLTALTDIAYTNVLAAMVCLAIVTSSTALTWLILWARRKDSRLGQFTVGSLLFLMLFASLYFSFCRWVAAHIALGVEMESGDSLLVAALACLVLALLAIPFLIWATESVVWLAALAVRTRTVRSWIVLLRSRAGDESR